MSPEVLNLIKRWQAKAPVCVCQWRRCRTGRDPQMCGPQRVAHAIERKMDEIGLQVPMSVRTELLHVDVGEGRQKFDHAVELWIEELNQAPNRVSKSG